MKNLHFKSKCTDAVKLFFLVFVLCLFVPVSTYGQPNLESVNEALTEEAENIIETGRIISNIIVVIGFVLLMLNIAFKVMDNSKATAVFIFIIVLRGLYEVIF